MKSLMKIVERCMADLDSLSVAYGSVRSWRVNTRAKSRWGQCRQVAPGVFDISISALLLEETVADQAAMDTIVHELLHTVPGCTGHRGKWKQLAERVNRELPGYRIQRCTPAEEKGIYLPETKRQYPYRLQCISCGKEILRQKLCPVVKAPYRYRCGLCGGKLKRIQ